ncbi:hypothetical protein [Amphritea sp. HPY]|uniref:hypothetical protein n=1 Tax=Amphritea sp. HPY TaxID=3421652 RepID=UPI003D7CE383
MDRTESLSQIISFGPHREEAFDRLFDHSTGSEFELVIASQELLLGVLQKYIAGTISTDDLEEWAMFVECRDDIDHSAIEDYVYALANPDLMGDIDMETITRMAELLNEA